MKKYLALLLSMSMVLSLAACSGTASTAASSASAQPSSEAVSSAAPAASSTAPASSADEVWLPYDENGVTKLDDRDATGSKGGVASSSWYASKAGLDVLQGGGNAVDAAVAVAYTLGVVEPYTSGLGGGGFMTIYSADTGKTTVVDYREIAPAASNPKQYIDANGEAVHFTDSKGNVFDGSYSETSQVGGLASGVPGEVAGLEYALDNFGTMKRADVMKDAIDLAENGYIVTATMRQCTEDEYYEVSRMPEVANYYLDANGLPLDVGTVLTNKDLAKTYKMIADKGTEGFYQGEVAKALVDSVQKYGGNMTLDDLENYKVEIREPVSSTYRDYSIYSLPPASSGGTHLIQILNIVENFDMSKVKLHSAEYCNLFASAFRMAFVDRAKYMADTAFTDVPLTGLTSKDYAKKLAAKITDKAQVFEADNPMPYESSSTTSFSVIDQWGNMVACTQTINDFYGSKVAVDGYGFIMNDEMNDFAVSNPDSVNCVEGGKRPLSSMCPSIVLDPDGKAFMTIGTPGGTRIFPTIAQVISNVLDYDMDIQDAINEARIYDNASNVFNYESDGVDPITPETIAELEKMGYKTQDKGAYNLFFGGVQGITVKDGVIRGGADPRRDGKALAY